MDVSGLYYPFKRYRLNRLKDKDPKMNCLKETHFTIKYIHSLKMKVCKKDGTQWQLKARKNSYTYITSLYNDQQINIIRICDKCICTQRQCTKILDLKGENMQYNNSGGSSTPHIY